jgi:ubiquinone/menaquinone biosynthesis C-methylase UbiE
VMAAILLRAFGRPRGMLGRLGGIVMARMNRACASWAVELLAVRSDDKVLEIGFGPGVGIELLAERTSAGYVAGVDPSREMVAQATARNAAAIKRGRVDLRHGSVESLPFLDDTFDRVLAVNSMQVWPDAVAGLRELRRVTKPDGRVALGFTAYSGQPKTGLAETLTAAGFARVQVVESDVGFCALATKS